MRRMPFSLPHPIAGYEPENEKSVFVYYRFWSGMWNIVTITGHQPRHDHEKPLWPATMPTTRKARGTILIPRPKSRRQNPEVRKSEQGREFCAHIQPFTTTETSSRHGRETPKRPSFQSDHAESVGGSLYGRATTPSGNSTGTIST